MADLEFTGERFLTSVNTPDICYEHWHRYFYATQYVRDKVVLDIASGEGYGSFLLAQQASSVTGVDISDEAVRHAQTHYRRDNLTFLTGSAAAIPVTAEHSFDVVVSFETIEHITQDEQQSFLREVIRLLKPEGIFIVSTPNKKHYSDDQNYHNDFHVHEFYLDDFKAFLETAFSHIQLLGQRVTPMSYLWNMEHQDTGLREYKLHFRQNVFAPSTAPLKDVYAVAVCSQQPMTAAKGSVLVDIDEQWVKAKQETINHLGHQLYERDLQIKALLAHVRTRDAYIYKTEHAKKVAGLPQNAVSLVIPVFNKAAYTRQCIECLSQTTPPELYNGVIVDNASTDETPALLKQLAGDVTIITNSANEGFVKACNQGAQATQSKYILFLNNDTEPQAGWLEEMLSLIEGDDDVGAVGAKLVYPNGQLQEAGGLIFSDGSGWNFGRQDAPDKDAYNEVAEVDYCSGACLLVRRDLFERLGGFDLRYAPAYYEDTDLCFGLRKLGYKVLYCPTAVVIHYEGITAGTDVRSGFKNHQVVNQQKFIEKWQTALSKQEPSPNETKRIPFTADRRKRGLEAFAAPRMAKKTSAETSILVIDPLMPAYDRASGSLRLFNLLRIMRSHGCRVTFIARNGVRQESYKRELEAMGIKVFATDPDKLAQLGTPIPAEKIDMQSILTEMFFDIAWLSFYEIAEQYLPEIRQYSPKTTILVDTVDVHFLRETRQAELYHDAALREKAKLTKKRELAVYGKADYLATVTQADKDVLIAHGVNADIFVVPNIHVIKQNTQPLGKRRDLVFVANFNHPPNADAVKYFCKDIFPEIRKRIPDCIFYVVGANPPDEIKRLANDSIIVTGYVMETEPYLNQCRVSVAPLRYGAGMKGKVGEALSLGLPVVTSSIGAEGMGLTHGQEVLIADTPGNFAQAVIRLYTDDLLWSTLARQGHAFIAKHYGFEAISERLKLQLETLAASQPGELTSIVVLAHNQLEYSKQCVDSILRHTHRPFELIIVDNQSTDNSPAYFDALAKDSALEKIESEYCRQIVVIKNRENAGFARGNNQGIAAARGTFVVLLNNDIVVTPGWLDKLIAVAKSHPKAGVVGPMTNYASHPQQVEAPGYDIGSLQGLDAFSEDYASRHQAQARKYWRLVGFCLLIKRSVIDAIGGLDHRFGLGNFEDDDFTLRASIAGFESWIAEDCYIHHYGSRTFEDVKIDYQASLRQNWEIFKRKWNIPADLPYGYAYNMKATIKKGFQPEHYCPLT